MYDHTLFLRTVSEFAARLLSPYDVDTVLEELMVRLIATLDLAGSGVALAVDGELQFATAVPDRVSELERIQIQNQSGPCTDAFRTASIVAISDLSTQRERWPKYCATARAAGLTSVAGIPMHLGGTTVGAVNLYADGSREWLEEDLAAAQVMTDMATGYLINASGLRQQEQLNEQLKAAQHSRAVIEQAKGVIATTHSVPMDQAFERIRRHARGHNATVRSVADAIVRLGLVI